MNVIIKRIDGEDYMHIKGLIKEIEDNKDKATIELLLGNLKNSLLEGEKLAQGITEESEE